jgi:hypothetical protein
MKKLINTIKTAVANAAIAVQNKVRSIVLPRLCVHPPRTGGHAARATSTPPSRS